MDNTTQIRDYVQGDEEQIVELLNTVYKGWPRVDVESSLDYWLWKYETRIIPKKLIKVITTNGEIQASMHSTLMEIKLYDSLILGNLGGDVAVHPQSRRKGYWTKILDSMTDARIEAGVKCLYNVTGNPIIIETFKKRGDFTQFPVPLVNLVQIKDIDLQLEKMPRDYPFITKLGYKGVSIISRISNPERHEKADTVKVTQIEKFTKTADNLWDKLSPSYDFIIKRNTDYLNWRYLDPRSGEYRVTQATEGDDVLGYIVTRINRYRSDYPVGYIVDLVALPGRNDAVDALVKDAQRHFDDEEVNIVNYLTVKGHPYEAALKRNGFLDSRVQVLLYYNTLGDASVKKQVQRLDPARTHICWGDTDTLPTRSPGNR